jgi:hypothetical protein
MFEQIGVEGSEPLRLSGTVFSFVPALPSFRLEFPFPTRNAYRRASAALKIACHSERSEESRPASLFCDPAWGRARFLASLGMTAFVSRFLGVAGGITDSHEDARSALECGGSTPPFRLPQLYSKAASSRRTPRRYAHLHTHRWARAHGDVRSSPPKHLGVVRGAIDVSHEAVLHVVMED